MIDTLKRKYSWVASILVTFVLLLTATRLLMTPAFIKLEYQMPNFPADDYGFTLQDRLQWAPITLQYLLNSEDSSFLADLQLDDGTPLYNQRELKHMVDVKDLAQAGLISWYAGIAIVVGLGIWSWRIDCMSDFKRMLAFGGKITVFTIAVLIVFILVSFNQLFIGFHKIFFDSDTWLFLYSDSLIRLFPMRFWQDVFIFLGILTLAMGLLVWKYFGESKK